MEINSITDLKRSWTYFIEIIKYEDVLSQNLRSTFSCFAGDGLASLMGLLPYNKILLSTYKYITVGIHFYKGVSKHKV